MLKKISLILVGALLVYWGLILLKSGLKGERKYFGPSFGGNLNFKPTHPAYNFTWGLLITLSGIAIIALTFINISSFTLF